MPKRAGGNAAHGGAATFEQSDREEVKDDICKHVQERDTLGHRLVVRNGHASERTIQSGLGPIAVKKPRVDDRREGSRFSSAILPRYLRKVPSLENLIPTLYLNGLSTSDMERALEGLLDASPWYLGQHRGALEGELPLNYDDTTLCTIEQIDVLWLRRRSLVRAFEVEHTTSVYSGLLRRADLIALQPNMKINPLCWHREQSGRKYFR